jgi:signal peptidase I
MDNSHPAEHAVSDNTEVPLRQKGEWSEFTRTALIAIILALVIRSFLFEPFNIPSGSMKPTLLIGDYLFVSKYAYGYSRYSFPFGIVPIDGRVFNGQKPQRGDVIVFKKPSHSSAQPSVDFIKRLIGLPGDTVQVLNGRLYINGVIVPRQFMKDVEDSTPYNTQYLKQYTETLPNGVQHLIFEESDTGALDNTPLYTVPQGHYFMMGDNRDNSQDSRVVNEVGFVPYENLVGRAERLFFSANGRASLYQPWKWPVGIRYGRLFMPIEMKRAE